MTSTKRARFWASALRLFGVGKHHRLRPDLPSVPATCRRCGDVAVRTAVMSSAARLGGALSSAAPDQRMSRMAIKRDALASPAAAQLSQRSLDEV